MQLSLQEVQQAAGARFTCGGGPGNQLVTGWSVDSRSINQGDLFFAIRGDHFDGHRFVQNAFDAGAVAAVVSEPVKVEDHPVLTVEDTVRSLGQIANRARCNWGKQVVAVTGSAGKTSTKDIIAALLSTRFRVGKTIGNLNNHIGLPLTLLRLPDDADVAVVEMGMNHAGEIRELANIARPQIGVVTNVGYAHIESFASIEDIAAVKRELVEELPLDGTAVLNADDARVLRFSESYRGKVFTYGLDNRADLNAENIESGAIGSHFNVEGVHFRTKLTGKHAVSNILAGLAVARVVDIPLRDLVGAVEQLTPGEMRGQRRQVGGLIILNDSYNSNPEAARSMIDVLRSEPSLRKIAVLGEMLELGAWAEKLHRNVGGYAANQGINILIGIGGAARYMVDEAVKLGMAADATFFFENAEEAGEFLRNFVLPGDALLFKGSRGTHVERALARMEE